MNVIAAGRIDQFAALEEYAFSPRIALVYKVAKNHTVRATWNRAFGAPNALNLYSDFPIGFLAPNVPLWLSAGSENHTFNSGTATELITGSSLPSQDMPLPLAYGAVTNAVSLRLFCYSRSRPP